MSLTTVTGISINEIADEVMVNLDSVIHETLYESGVSVDEFPEFRRALLTILVDILEESIDESE